MRALKKVEKNDVRGVAIRRAKLGRIERKIVAVTEVKALLAACSPYRATMRCNMRCTCAIRPYRIEPPVRADGTVRGRSFDYLSANSAVSTSAINHERRIERAMTNRRHGNLLALIERQREREKEKNR